MFNWKNTAENLLLVLISVIVGVGIGYYVSVQTAKAMLDEQKSIIELAIKKETNTINNTVIAEFKKIKSTKSEPINIVIDPTTRSVISNKDTSQQIILVEKKKGFFRRLFHKKDLPQ